jgi:hypothetical protein
MRLIKRLMAGLENLPVIPCLERRIRGRALRDYLRGEHQKPPYPFNIAPTYLQSEMTLRVDDYW